MDTDLAFRSGRIVREPSHRLRAVAVPDELLFVGPLIGFRNV